ncbi:hypothetical protein [Vibrio phage vB_VibM_10AMN]|uniref:Uncharacterized protein n=1 Tax=Staphylococcus phage vB_VibM_10AMN12 TaxID=3076785 RepID=A0AA96KTH7_9CAUD|nr:hypothetical protein [Vibrio phage vB_VibM_10AMN]WNO47429.1 hypothetical protein [Staphylococcus phage vB_VibM_10AMN12]
MSNTKSPMFFTQKDYETAYYNKAESCKKRLITMGLSKAEYIALLRARPNMKCFYTGEEFVLNQGANHPNYPTIDRLDNTKGYTENNVALCTSKVNDLKNKFIESNKSRKNISHKDMFLLTRIEKSLSMKVGWNEKLAEYSEIFRKARESDLEKKAKVIKDCNKLLRETALERQKREVQLTTGFAQTCKQFEEYGKVFGISFKEWRDINRRKNCSITGLPLDEGNRALFVKDKTVDIITKKDVILVHKDVQQGLDHITKGDSKVVKSLMRNCKKLG